LQIDILMNLGLDLEPGREGGTWFGTSTTSKTGALLNILEPAPSNVKKGRGKLKP